MNQQNAWLDNQQVVHEMDRYIQRYHPRSIDIGRELWAYLRDSGRLHSWGNVCDAKYLDDEIPVFLTEEIDAIAYRPNLSSHERDLFPRTR